VPVLSNANEIRLTLIAWIQGRRGVLDDLGNLIESDAEATEYPFEMTEAGSSDVPSEDDTDHGLHSDSDLEPARNNIGRLKTIIPALFGCTCLVFFLYWSWVITGWVGQKLLNIPGAAGNVAGLIVIVGFFAAWAVASSRFENARGYRRACRGLRDVKDRLRIFSCIHAHRVCPACSFSLKNHLHDEAEEVRCSECGAQWMPQNWVGFLTHERTSVHSDLKRKSARRSSCLVDARDQMYAIHHGIALRERKALIRSTPTTGIWRSQVLVVMSFLPLIVGVMVVMLWTIGFSKGNATLLLATVFIVILITVMIIVFRTYLETARTRRIRQLGCDMIDQGLCGCCGSELDDRPHIVDGALACHGCGLFFDPRTQVRTHHCRKRIPWERFKADPVFQRFK
jgi:hypothetical protein